MSAPTVQEQRLRAMLAELADSTPIRSGPMTLPADDLAGDSTPDAAVGQVVALDGPTSRRARPSPTAGPSRPSRLPWVLSAVAGVLVVVLLGTILLARDAADPFASDPTQVPPVDLAALDGGRLAFVLGNDLYLADGARGETRRITDVGSGHEVSDVGWSHDGEWVAFTVHDESGLWVVRRDGSERHRLPGSPSSYAWSPTGDELVYATADEVRLGQVHGSSRRLEGNVTPMPFTTVVWSPDGNRVAFAGSAGNLAVGTLQGRPDPGWRSGVSQPVQEVLAWPRDDRLLVRQLGDGGSIMAFDPGTAAESTLLAAPDPTFDVTYDLATDRTGSRVALVSGQRVVVCPLDRGTVFACDPIDVPGRTPSSPRFSDDATELSFIAVEPSGRAELVRVDLGAAPPDRLLVPVGLVNTLRRGTIDLGSTGYGIEPEPQIPLGSGGYLVRVDESRIERQGTDGPDGHRVVVAGDRFDPPADDYPGGSGLAYWHP